MPSLPTTANTITFHEIQASYHDRLAALHLDLGETEAAQAHTAAAEAHRAATTKPVTDRATNAAMRLARIADQASQRVRRDP